ncbi:MAG: hypothetical protein A2X05_12955 [Bacteroidetes bacterium GWE2_41_25]|nr:MAG: hypothetical protein A2X03_08860 [Bacteroidetes bacterium GWA2_40_15]OFY10016.1 MAG: hypothetical protein A2X05_12955 [Bacteroidetes bacterium GWE2_41_25]HBQ83623.1 hypothetical protein [Bacteroidales bacterium]
MRILPESPYFKVSLVIILCILFFRSDAFAQNTADKSSLSNSSIRVEYSDPLTRSAGITGIPLSSQTGSPEIRISIYRNASYQVVIHEIDRGNYTEINGEIESLSGENSCVTLRIILPLKGENWKWYSGLDKSQEMKAGLMYCDTVSIRTTVPPAGAFNGMNLSDGGYGDAVGKGTMSYYPLCAVETDNIGTGIGVDITLPVVFRFIGDKGKGVVTEFDFATSPLTKKFPNRAFFRMSRFEFDVVRGMRSALRAYYSIYSEAFKKRVVNEGIWLPFTAMRSIAGWEDFGFAFHETSWGSSDMKEGQKISHILSDKGTGVLSFQYTEPWDVQLPIKTKIIPYDTLVSPQMINERHKAYLDVSATKDKNGLWQTRRLETPWFSTGWAVSITTNCDPELPGFNRYNYVLDREINPARKLNADGIYFDSMEWNWHHDLNYNEDHLAFTDYPLTYSARVGRPAIWHFVSEFEFMKKIADEMHSQGKLAMGNGHGWNPFAASNLDLFGAELSWYSSGDHNVTALDFKRAISFQKPIVFLLNEGLNDKAFTEAPYRGYEIYFEKMLAYGFFPSFFSVDASSDPYWQDKKKIENGRPFFKKYIPLIKEISGAGWEPVTAAKVSTEDVRIERFGTSDKFYFTVRNNGTKDAACNIELDLNELGLADGFTAVEMISGNQVPIKGNRLALTVPSGRTKAIKILLP